MRPVPSILDVLLFQAALNQSVAVLDVEFFVYSALIDPLLIVKRPAKFCLTTPGECDKQSTHPKCKFQCG